MLWSFGHFPVDFQQITSLQSFEAKVLVAEIPVVDDGRVEPVGVGHDDLVVLLGDHGGGPAVGFHVVQIFDHFAEYLLGLLMQIGDDNPVKRYLHNNRIFLGIKKGGNDSG